MNEPDYRELWRLLREGFTTRHWEYFAGWEIVAAMEAMEGSWEDSTQVNAPSGATDAASSDS